MVSCEWNCFSFIDFQSIALLSFPSYTASQLLFLIGLYAVVLWFSRLSVISLLALRDSFLLIAAHLHRQITLPRWNAGMMMKWQKEHIWTCPKECLTHIFYVTKIVQLYLLFFCQYIFCVVLIFSNPVAINVKGKEIQNPCSFFQPEASISS